MTAGTWAKCSCALCFSPQCSNPKPADATLAQSHTASSRIAAYCAVSHSSIAKYVFRVIITKPTEEELLDTSFLSVPAEKLVTGSHREGVDITLTPGISTYGASAYVLSHSMSFVSSSSSLLKRSSWAQVSTSTTADVTGGTSSKMRSLFFTSAFQLKNC